MSSFSINARASFSVDGARAGVSTDGAGAAFTTRATGSSFSVNRASAAMSTVSAAMHGNIGTVIFSGEIPKNYGLITYNGSVITVS